MKYTVQSTKYVFKNILYLFPFAILPALFLSLSTDQFAVSGVVKAFFTGHIHDWSFTAIFRAISVLNFASWQAIVFGLVGIIVIVPCVALMMALLEKHMRIGKRTFNGLWGKLNDNFISTCGCVILILAIYEIWTLLISAFMFLFSRITLLPLAYVFIVLTFIVFHVLLVVAVSTIYLWLPCMQITGFRAFEALGYSYHLMGQIKGRIIAAQLFILMIVEALLCACAVFVTAGLAFSIITAVLYAGVLMIFCVRMQIVYFDRDHIERADLVKYYQK